MRQPIQPSKRWPFVSYVLLYIAVEMCKYVDARATESRWNWHLRRLAMSGVASLAEKAEDRCPMSRLENLTKQLRLLSKIDKAFIIVLAVRIAYSLIGYAAGLEPPGFNLVRLAFILVLIVFLFLSVPKLLRKLLWRVRH